MKNKNDAQQCIQFMAGEVLNMSDLTINKHRCEWKDLCFKTATKPYTKR